jgi:hypothetical protein
MVKRQVRTAEGHQIQPTLLHQQITLQQQQRRGPGQRTPIQKRPQPQRAQHGPRQILFFRESRVSPELRKRSGGISLLMSEVKLDHNSRVGSWVGSNYQGKKKIHSTFSSLMTRTPSGESFSHLAFDLSQFCEGNCINIAVY